MTLKWNTKTYTINDIEYYLFAFAFLDCRKKKKAENFVPIEYFMMHTSEMPPDVFGILGSMTCEQINKLLENFNQSEHESLNMTHEALLNLLLLSHCKQKPYPGTQGVQKWTVTIILIIFLVFGLIGNALSATIMFRRSRRGLSSYFYLALLAIIDICVLYTGCLSFLIETMFNYQIQLYSSIVCRLDFYIKHLFTYISAWLIVAVTFERFIVVRFPFQSIRICRMHIAYTISIVMFTVFGLYTSHCFFTINIFRVNLQTDEGYHPNHLVCDLKLYSNLLAFIDLCLYSVLPSVIILSLNVLIILTILRAMRKRREFLQENNGISISETFQRNKNKTSSTKCTPFLHSRSLG